MAWREFNACATSAGVKSVAIFRVVATAAAAAVAVVVVDDMLFETAKCWCDFVRLYKNVSVG